MFPHYCVSISDVDRTCHGEWINAAYHCSTERMILMHDDDMLEPQFGSAYMEQIKPMLDDGVGFASWRAHLIYDDGHRKETEYFTKFGRPQKTGVYRSSELEKIVGCMGRLSLSPIVSVLNRGVLIESLKELSENIKDPKCIYRPGMNLGTEILAYLRHISTFNDWFFCSEVLSMYGSHEGSGTVDAQNRNSLEPLTQGYDVVRSHFNKHRAHRFNHKPKLLLLYSDYSASSPDEMDRLANAKQSWKFHFDGGDVLEFPVSNSDLGRTSRDIGDHKDVPFINDIIDYGMRFARPEDIVVYINRDVALTTQAPERIIESVTWNHGATAAFRRNIKYPDFGRVYRTVTNHPPDGGFDVFAFTPKWWRENRDKIPLMYIGREGWDTVIRNLIEEVASGKRLSNLPGDFWNNPHYCDNVCWHTAHTPYWQENKLTSPSQVHNRKVCREFFKERNNAGMLWSIDAATKPHESVPPRKRLIELSGFKR